MHVSLNFFLLSMLANNIFIYLIYPNNNRDVYLYIYSVSAYMG